MLDIIPDKELTESEFREWIESTEQSVKESIETFDRHTCLSHGFKLEEAMTPGIYIRELTMPANSLVFSKVHITEHPYVITRGVVSVYDGKTVNTFTAPHKGITKSGTKRLLYVHEETTWVTFHPAPSDKIEEMDKNGVITCDTFEEYDNIKGALCHSQQQPQ